MLDGHGELERDDDVLQEAHFVLARLVLLSYLISNFCYVNALFFDIGVDWGYIAVHQGIGFDSK